MPAYRETKRLAITAAVPFRANQLFTLGDFRLGCYRTELVPLLASSGTITDVRFPKTGKHISYSVLRSNINKKQMMQKFLEQASENQIGWIGRFLKERCSTGPNLRVLSRDLYNEYLRFTKAHKIKNPMTQNDLGRNLNQRGFGHFRTTGGKRGWAGISVVRN